MTYLSIFAVNKTVWQQRVPPLDRRGLSVVWRESRSADAQRPQVGHPAQGADRLLGDVLGKETGVSDNGLREVAHAQGTAAGLLAILDGLRHRGLR